METHKHTFRNERELLPPESDQKKEWQRVWVTLLETQHLCRLPSKFGDMLPYGCPPKKGLKVPEAGSPSPWAEQDGQFLMRGSGKEDRVHAAANCLGKAMGWQGVERFRRRLITWPGVLESSPTFTGTDYVVLARNVFYFIFPVHKILNRWKWAKATAACGYSRTTRQVGQTALCSQEPRRFLSFASVALVIRYTSLLKDRREVNVNSSAADASTQSDDNTFALWRGEKRRLAAAERSRACTCVCGREREREDWQGLMWRENRGK